MKKLIIWILFFMIILYSSKGCADDFDLQINIPEFLMRINLHGQLLYQAPICIGRPTEKTPSGEFLIINKIVNPTWYPEGRDPVPAGPTNPLGKYWLGLNKLGYGIHGNINSASIGQAVSAGCIRMHNQDMQILYHLVDVGANVEIIYQTLSVITEKENLKVQILPDVYREGTNNIFSFLNLVSDLKRKKQIFIPYLNYLLKKYQSGTFDLPWKMDLYYQGQKYSNIAFRSGSEIYLDPRVLEELIAREDLLRDYLVTYPERYLNLQILRTKVSADVLFYATEDGIYLHLLRMTLP